MSQNKKLLQFISEQMNKPTKPKVPRNQWQHPGEVTVIPSKHITMKGVTYPVVGVDANGVAFKMQPGNNYSFTKGPVTEFPAMQKGGRVPIYTENPNDPRIKAYQDSLSLYKSNPPTEFLKQALKQGTYAKSKKPIKGNGIQPIFIYDPVIEVMNSLSSAGLPYAMWQPAITKENKNLYYQDSDGIVRDIKSGNVIVIKSHVYKKPVQPVVFRKPQPKAKEVVSTPLLPTSVATEIPTSVSPKAKPEEKKTQYSFTYPTFDKYVHKTIYFPTQKALIEFTDKYGYISREFRDSSGSATGYYTPEYKNGGILYKAQYGPPATSFGPIIPFRRNNQNGDIGTYYPQIGRSYRQDQMMKMALEEKRRREMERNIANTRQTYLKPAGTTQRTPDEIAAMNRERLRAQVQQNSPLAQTMGLFTPKGNNPEAGRVGAEMFANMNPIITSQVLSALRLNDLGKGKNPYGFGNGLFSNVLGGIGLLGDAFNLNALKSLKPSGIQSNYQVNTMVGKPSPTQSSYKIYTLGVDPSTAGTNDPFSIYVSNNISKSNNNYSSAPKKINLPYGVGHNIAKGGAFNNGVFTLKNDPNHLFKLENIKRMVDLTDWYDYSKFDFVNSMKNIQDPRIGRVVKQIDINPDIRGLYVSNVPGISLQKAPGRVIRKAITKDNIHDLFKKIKDVTRNNLTFDFVGENYNIDPKTGQFGIFDISPVIPESVQNNYWGSQNWMEQITGDIHLKGLDDQARRASSQNIHKALYDKIFTDMRRAYMRNVNRYANAPTVSMDRLTRYRQAFKNRLKDNFNNAFSTLDLNDPNIYYTKGGLVKYQTAGMVNIPAIANQYKNGGQYGGLDRWFAEKWVDVKTGKECGRKEGEDRKYPACRPSKRISNDTPKTASELSPAERQKFISSKTSSERINYQHRRK